METIQQQIGALQTSVKRQRLLNIALLGLIVAGGFIAAVRPVGDATFDTITCKGWNVVDKNGKERITAFTNSDGQASVQWLDKDGKMRIGAATDANGYASVQWHDKDGKQRIAAATFADGNATVSWFDKDEKMRITAITFLDGFSSLAWFDKDMKTRIEAGITADGKVLLPTKDLEPPKP